MDFTNIIKQYVSIQDNSIKELREMYRTVKQTEATIIDSENTINQLTQTINALRIEKEELLSTIDKKETVLNDINTRLQSLAEQVDYFLAATSVNTTTETTVNEATTSEEVTNEEVVSDEEISAF